MLTRLATLTAGAAIVTLPALAQAAPSASGPSIMSQVLLFLPLILIFYFLLIRPQQQRAKKHKALIENIKKGDTIVTSGRTGRRRSRPDHQADGDRRSWQEPACRRQRLRACRARLRPFA